MDDLRRPTGILFAVLGAILLVYGLASPDTRPPLDPGVNVNLWTGLTLLVFGGCLFCLSLRTKS
jgi:hypothetical protein